MAQLLGLPGAQRGVDVSAGREERLGERPGIERCLGAAGRRVGAAGDPGVPDEAGAARHHARHVGVGDDGQERPVRRPDQFDERSEGDAGRGAPVQLVARLVGEGIRMDRNLVPHARAVGHDALELRPFRDVPVPLEIDRALGHGIGDQMPVP